MEPWEWIALFSLCLALILSLRMRFRIRSRSTTVVDVQEETSCPQLHPKHKVFLSHSGAEKPFVRKLCKLLEKHDHYPFFDQRDDSLKKGEKFAGLIIDAAQKCLVAVVVLSEGYLSSKWPMIELVEFVRASKSKNKNLKLLPLFFKVFVDDISDASIQKKWMPKWKVLARADSRVDPKVWTEAVQELRRWNGLVFKGFESKEDYRDAVVKAVFKLAPPDLLYDMSKIHGGSRICKILAGKFEEHPKRSALVLGLYGMGGMGKTTISKCLCNYFNQEFLGRVCYIEMQDGKDALIRQKIVMRKLLRLVEPLMENIDDASQGWDILKRRLKENPVFLVIDNVRLDEEDEALEYLNIEYNLQSKIMVVSRSLVIVERLLGGRGYCCEILSLERKEAVGVLLQQGGRNLEYSSLSDEERGIVEGCVEEAYFQDHDLTQTTSSLGNRGRHYHPLALRALGAYLHKKSKTCGVLSWAMYLDEYRELKSTGVPYENQIFMILGLPFSTLGKMEQLMYIDIVLYAPCALKYRVLSNSGLEDMVIWLANIHNVATSKVKHRICYLSELALVNVEREEIIVHDLYKEYAKWALKNIGNSGEPVGVWCDVPSTQSATIPEELQKSPSGNCWQELQRIHLQFCSFHGFAVKKFQEWRNIVVLQIISCDNVTTLNFEELTCLRHLELRSLKHLQTLNLIGDESTSHDTVPQASCVEPKLYFSRPWLQYVILEWLPLLKFLPSFSPFASLKYLEVVGCIELREPPRVQYCSRLEQMHLKWYLKQNTLPNLDGLTSLRVLSIYAPWHERRYEALKLEGLSSLSSLQSLELDNIPVGDLNGLDNLTSVEYICLYGLYWLEDLPPLENLASSSLHLLQVHGCGKYVERMLEPLKTLICQKLERLEAQGKCVPDFPRNSASVKKVVDDKL